VSLRTRFTLHLLLGLVVIFCASLAFAEIAWRTVANQPLALLDRQITDWFHAHATRPLTIVALLVSFFGSVRFLSCATLLACWFLWRREMWNRLLVFVCAMAGESGLNIALKHAFHRQRPAFENPLVTLTSYGFPSGHTMGATVFYGLAAFIIAGLAKRWRPHTFGAALLVIGAIGLSRIYLGAHYTSDVLGAFAAGAAWLACCWTGLVTLRRSGR
jgi:undecaprenyl-diphosphatase